MEFVWIETISAWVGKYEVTNGEFRRFRENCFSLGFRLVLSSRTPGLAPNKSPRRPMPIGNFTGQMDELTIWNTALNATEIEDIYRIHKP